ncbi:high-affinity branched-chain amino acid ABC transporter permease LivM [Klebsiella pneumoniae subsp. pneumoniae]
MGSQNFHRRGKMMSDFMNKHVLVTGGSSGIGLGIALGFARAGAKVTITARTPSRIDSAIGQAAEQGLTLRGLTCNVSHAEEVKACVAEAAQQWGGLDIVCCNAGIFPSAPLADMSEQQWDEVQAINSKGTFLTVQAALPWLKRAEYGRIILTSSITGPVTGYPGWAHYAASKAAQLGFMRSWIIPLLVGLAIVFPFLATKYLLTVAILGLIYVLLGLGLNIVVGLAGLLDLGYVAFYAIGAYGLALGYQYLGLGFWAMLPLGAVMAALAGALLGFPVLRMHGDYLAIVTLGFGEIIRLVLNNWVSFTGGPNGVPVPSPTLFGLEFTRRAKDGGIPIHEFFHVSYNPNLKFIFLYAVLCLVVMLVLLVKHRLTRMPIGRAWEALREDEIACRAMGLNHVLVKLSAFMLGASTAGIAGVFFASYQGFVNPTSFTFFESALILAIVVLGGMGSTLGVVLAAFVLTVTPELLRGFDEYRVLLFGVLMVMMMIWRPRGLVRTSRSGVALRKGVAP